MLLHDAGIMRAIEDKSIGINPLNRDALQPSSLDLRLGNEFAIVDTSGIAVLNPKLDNSWRVIRKTIDPGNSFLLWPRSFVLASTVESVKLSLNIAARVEGKSSLGRLGLLVHITAGFIDPGFEGQVTLELANMLDVPIRLYPDMPVAQICFFLMAGYATSYQERGKYMNQQGPVASLYHKNFEQPVAVSQKMRMKS